MANVFVQRQFAGVLGSGEPTTESEIGLANSLWQSTDVYPSNILKLDPGLLSTGSALIPAALSATYTVSLPPDYVSTNRLSFTMKADQNVRVTVTSPDHPDSVVLVYCPDDSSGFYSVVETVTAIQIVSIAAVDTNVEYVCFSYPDLTSASSWRDGYQTLGVISD